MFLQWKCICIIFYMMLRVAMSSTKNVFDFGLDFLSKTCLWGMIKLSLFDVVFLYQFWIKFASILTALDTQNPSKMRGHPWLDRLLTLTEWLFHKKIQEFLNISPWPSLNHCSKIDFWLILDPPRRLQGVSRRLKMAPKRHQAQTVDASHCTVRSKQTDLSFH